MAVLDALPFQGKYPGLEVGNDRLLFLKRGYQSTHTLLEQHNDGFFALLIGRMYLFAGWYMQCVHSYIVPALCDSGKSKSLA